jgi:hypothetical protein
MTTRHWTLTAQEVLQILKEKAKMTSDFNKGTTNRPAPALELQT